MKKTIYHGSNHIIEKPQYGYGKPYNDYGVGFYCTENPNMAKEWGVSIDHNGYANEYQIECDGLTILDLNAPEYTMLHWLTILLENREFDASTPLAAEAKDYLLQNFHLDYKTADVIIGYRADDSYFTFARAFLRNDISLEQLTRALRLGDLGQQIVLKSPRAFEAIEFVEATVAPSAVYYPKRKERDEKARALYREEAAREGIDGIYLRDLLRDEVTDLAGL